MQCLRSVLTFHNCYCLCIDVHVHVLLVINMMVVDNLASDPSEQISIWPPQMRHAPLTFKLGFTTPFEIG
jgi:hypothetical protein